MEVKANCAIIFRGGRVRKGEVFEATAEEAAHLGSDVSPVVSEEAPAAEINLADLSLDEMTYAQLQARAKELELSASGTAADLRERIALSLTAPAGDEDHDPEACEVEDCEKCPAEDDHNAEDCEVEDCEKCAAITND
jgi:hypothetical protein